MDAKEVYQYFVTLTLAQFLFKCLIWTAQRLIYFKVFQIMILRLADADPAYLSEVPGFASGYLDPGSCRKLAKDRTYKLPELFVDRILANGDKCYAFTQDGVVASFGWYSDKPGVVNGPFQLHYDNAYIYRHSGFTLPRFRGRRLHAFVMVAGLKDYEERGYKGMISIVEAQNYNARRSDDRLGFRTFGTIFVIRLFGRYFIRASKGCEKHSCTMTVLGS